jgi:hypothetical protein
MRKKMAKVRVGKSKPGPPSVAADGRDDVSGHV